MPAEEKAALYKDIGEDSSAAAGACSDTADYSHTAASKVLLTADNVMAHTFDGGQYTAIKAHLNFLNEIKDQRTRIEFHHFLLNRSSHEFIHFALAATSLVLLPSAIVNNSKDFMYSIHSANFTFRCIVSLLALISSAIAAYTAILLCFRQNKISSPKLFKSSYFSFLSTFISQAFLAESSNVTTLYTILFTQIQVHFIASFLRRTFGFNCSQNTSNFNSYFGGGKCYDGETEVQFLAYNAFLMFLIPILFFTCLSETPIRWVWINFSVAVITYIVSMIVKGAFASLPLTLMYMIVGIFIIRDVQFRNLMLYFSNVRLRAVLQENERMAQENRASELRHMIANVAHDLKTPLSSFTTGLDFMQMILSDCSGELTKKKLEEIDFKQVIDVIQSCINNIRNTNSFMLMTINRCIDYTKASKGLKLVPRYETIDLLDTLQLPLSCMQNIQNRMEIYMNVIPHEICSHIITDKQWLQENVLCLLSNAVKYSSEGLITISVSLVGGNNEPVHPSANGNFSVMKDLISRASTPSSNRVTPFEGAKTCGFTVDAKKVFFTGAELKSNDIQIRFEIEDTGIGMSDEAMSSLFNPFKQTQKLAGGTGLGLYSMAKRVEALTGKCGVTRRRDGKQGSLFWFSFPYKPDEVTAFNTLQDPDMMRTAPSLDIKNSSFFTSFLGRQSTNDQQPITPKSPKSFRALRINTLGTTKETGSKDNDDTSTVLDKEQVSDKTKFAKNLHILIADDSVSITKMTTMMLKKLGHKVDVAENGEIALRKIKEHLETGCKYDIVLMDLQMPIMDGLEATRRIRALENKHEYAHQHIIGLSANSDYETMEEAYKIGVDAFMAKPFNVNTFNETIQKVYG